jgi:hypothetical protein
MKVQDGRPRRCGLTGEPPLYYLRSCEPAWQGQGVHVDRDRSVGLRLLQRDAHQSVRAKIKPLLRGTPSGLAGHYRILVNPEGSAYAYSYARFISDLYLATGVSSPADAKSGWPRSSGHPGGSRRVLGSAIPDRRRRRRGS